MLLCVEILSALKLIPAIGWYLVRQILKIGAFMRSSKDGYSFEGLRVRGVTSSGMCAMQVRYSYMSCVASLYIRSLPFVTCSCFLSYSSVPVFDERTRQMEDSTSNKECPRL